MRIEAGESWDRLCLDSAIDELRDIAITRRKRGAVTIACQLERAISIIRARRESPEGGGEPSKGEG